ncbi:hypothetical protein SVIOM342S_00878 [Streptomyces violaceorubidus]
MFGPPVGVFGQVSACSVHHQYSSRVSPFQAKTGTPCGLSGVPFGPTAMAAAAWSWVEKMLQEAQRTSAPRATRVSMSTAVCTVMCREPVTRAPASGWVSAYSLRIAIRPGISCSARVISLRPNAARERSATLKSCRLSTVVITGCSSGWVEVGTADLRGGGHRGAQKDTGMPAYAQRSPSEALSPSAGPSWTARPPSAATSGSVPSYTAGARRPPVRLRTLPARSTQGDDRAAGWSFSGRRAGWSGRRGSPRGRGPWRPRTRCRCPVSR